MTGRVLLEEASIAEGNKMNRGRCSSDDFSVGTTSTASESQDDSMNSGRNSPIDTDEDDPFPTTAVEDDLFHNECSAESRNDEDDEDEDSCDTNSNMENTTKNSNSPSGPKKRRRRRRARKGNKTNGGKNSKQNNRRRVRSPQPATEDSLSEDERARYIALDCEMVGVGYGGHRSALARVCMVNWNYEVVFDTFVKVEEPVTDFRTFVSGIREDDVTSEDAMNWTSCRMAVMEQLQGKILVGHALRNDLRALAITHPWQDTRDTGKYEPFMKCRFEDGILWPRKLKELAFEKLGREVQPSGKEHDPAEDARTALELYKAVRTKWEKVMTYKINRTREIEEEQRQHHLQF